MSGSFGPWSTALGESTSARLSQSWKSRMARLASLRNCDAALTRRDCLRLGAAGLAVSALPTLRPAPALGARGDDRAGVDKGPTGRIYARTIFLGPDKNQPNLDCPTGIISLAPGGGQTEVVVDKLVDMVRASPDGKTLAYGFEGAVWTRDAQGEGEPTKVTDLGNGACWSPDGKQLVVTKGKPGEAEGRWVFETWRVGVDGKDPVKLDIAETDMVADWSPDGDWLVAVSGGGGSDQVVVMRPDGKERRALTKRGYYGMPRFAPDSRRVVHNQQVNRECLWTVGVDGKDRHVVYEEKDVVPHACFSPDGKYLAAAMFTWQRDEKDRKVVRIGEGDSRIEIMDADGKDSVRLTPPVLDITLPDWR